MAKIDRLTKQVQEHLDADEEILAVVLGSYEIKIFGRDSVRKGIFAATNRRLVFYAKKLTGYEFEVFPYSNISSFEAGKNMMGHTLSFFASGNKAKMKWIRYGDVSRLYEYVSSQIGKQSAPAQATQVDVADQIKKLAELRDQGILTEEEFTAKKKDLLARL